MTDDDREIEPTPEGLCPADGPLRRRLFEIVFHADDPVGRGFDVALIVAILASVAVVMLESVGTFQESHGRGLLAAEWFFTAIFTVEYVLRLWVVRNPLKYAFSFYGLIDLFSILPTFISLIVPNAQALLTVRILRALRVFRVLKLANYLDEAQQLSQALAASKRKILVFIFVVLTLVTVMGSAMYLIEGGANGFDSIPRSVYWAVVTVTTVGYGDISPATPLGQGVALALMIMGYGIIAVPTGIVTVELNRERDERLAANADARVAAAVATQFAECPRCGRSEHDGDARYCKACGERIVPVHPAEVGEATPAASG